MIQLRTKRLATAGFVMAATLALSGCFWDSGSDSTAVASSDLTVAASGSTLAAVTNTAYTFPAVPDFGTAGATTVTFTSATESPSFSISAAEGTATGTTTFGSCIFTVTNSTFPASSPLATGKTVRVNPCSLTVKVAGVTVTASPTPTSVPTVLVLGTLSSGTVSKVITIDSNGKVTIGTVSLGTIPVVVSTGATGGGN